MANLFIEDPPYLRHKFRGAIDYLGFGLMAIWLGTMQLVLDKGQEADWFEANWIRVTTLVSAAALVGFIIREFMSREPIVQLRILGNRNFGLGTLIATMYGFSLYGITALLPLFLQTQLGYSALASGLAVRDVYKRQPPTRASRSSFMVSIRIPCWSSIARISTEQAWFQVRSDT